MRLHPVFRFLVRNWPLRLGALALAIVLYFGLVISQNARVWPGAVPIQAINQPAGTFLLDRLGDVRSIRYLAPVDVAAQVSTSSFVAVADLSGVSAQSAGAPVTVPVTVKSSDSRIQIIGWDPPTVAARLDPVTTRSVPVEVEQGTVPTGLTTDAPVVDRTTVTVRGARSLVDNVASAVARVSIDASGINVDQNVDLIAVDARGDQVAPVNIEPASVHVKILVAEQLSNRTVPIVPVVTGDLADGYAIQSIAVAPLTATVSGSQSVIGTLTSIQTATIDVTGKSATAVYTVALAPPNNVTVMSGQQVKVTVTVAAESGSRSFGAGLMMIGARSDRLYLLSVPDVLVTLGGTQAALDGIDPAGLAATIDVTGISDGTVTLAVRFAPPTGTTLVAISPARVQVTVSVPATPSPSPTATPTATPAPTPTPQPPPAQ